MLPSRCCGRWPKPVRNLTVSRSRKPLTKRRTPYFERPNLRGPMVDLDLADAEAAGRRQHRDEAVQLAVEPDFAEHLGAVALHAAVVVVQLDAGQPADHAS